MIIPVIIIIVSEIPYMVKLLRGKIFTFRLENGYSWENNLDSMLEDLYIAILPINKIMIQPFNNTSYQY